MSALKLMTMIVCSGEFLSLMVCLSIEIPSINIVILLKFKIFRGKTANASYGHRLQVRTRFRTS